MKTMKTVNTWWVLFVCTLGLGVVLAVVLFVPEPANGHGEEHPEFAPMLRGGDGWQRHGGLLAAGWVYGALQIGCFVTALRLGLRSGKGPLAFLLLGGVVYLATFTLVMAAYANEINSGAVYRVLGFPLSTAVMLFVLWPMPVVFVAGYVLKFDSWILTPEDRRKFDELCQRNRLRGGE